MRCFVQPGVPDVAQRMHRINCAHVIHLRKNVSRLFKKYLKIIFRRGARAERDEHAVVHAPSHDADSKWRGSH
jgi:sorbitol-specific phosphotransferase system component IIA